MNIGLFVKDFAVGKKFARNGLPTKSGAEFHAENHALQLIKRGHHVTIFAKKRMWATKARELINGIDLVRLHEPFRGLEIIIRLLTTHRHLDAFYIIGTPKFAVWAILFARLTNKPVTLALTAKMEIFDGQKNWRNRLFTTCTNYIATTHEIRDGYIEKGHISPKKITVLAHGIDTKKFSPLKAKDKNELRLKHHIPIDAEVILFCARIVEDKGILTVMNMWPMLHKKHPKARLFIVGGGRNDLMDKVHEFEQKFVDSVVVTGEVDEPREYYRLADIYVFPSRHEALPTSLIEAMASGLVPVASNIGGVSDLVFDGKTGYLADVDNAHDFAEKIEILLENKQEQQRMSENAMTLVKKMCDYDNVIDKLADVIASPVAKGNDYLQP